jgi:hypothetical protein
VIIEVDCSGMSWDDVPRDLTEADYDYYRCFAPRLMHISSELKAARLASDGETIVQSLLNEVRNKLIDLCMFSILPAQVVVGFRESCDANRDPLLFFLGYDEGSSQSVNSTVKTPDGDVKTWVYVSLRPGLIGRLRPNVFQSVTRLFRDGELPSPKALIESSRFIVIGYYAAACELLAELVVECLHDTDDAADNHDDRILPGDGLQCGDTVFVWGGKPYTSITPTIAMVLKVLLKAYRDSREATVPEFEHSLGEIRNGFGSLFVVGKSPNKTIHPVRSTILPPHGKGRAKYRLIDPIKGK